MTWRQPPSGIGEREGGRDTIGATPDGQRHVVIGRRHGAGDETRRVREWPSCGEGRAEARSKRRGEERTAENSGQTASVKLEDGAESESEAARQPVEARDRGDENGRESWRYRDRASSE